MEWVEPCGITAITQGTIIGGVGWGEEYGPALSIVLSNACDLEHDKAGFVVVAALIPAAETLASTKEFINKVQGADSNKQLKKKQWESFSAYIEDFIHNKNVGRYYYFNPAPVIDVPPLFVDFQYIQSIHISRFKILVADAQVEAVGQLKHPFVEKMMMHFVGYTGRVPSDREDGAQEAFDMQNLANGYTCKV